jgi:Domain of unknown function (DUF4189)
MKFILVLVLIAASFTASATNATADNNYGALATSPDADFGYSYNHSDESAARERALAECVKFSQQCSIKKTFDNTCMIIASSRNGAMGWTTGYVRPEGNRRALEECRSLGGRKCSSDGGKIHPELQVTAKISQLVLPQLGHTPAPLSGLPVRLKRREDPHTPLLPWASASA